MFELTFAYLEVGVIARDLECVAAALNLIERHGVSLGLSFNVTKCELIVPAAKASVNLVTLITAQLLTDLETGRS